MKLRPLSDRVIVKLAEVRNRTASGLIIPGKQAEIATLGTVLAVGPGRQRSDGTRIPVKVKRGDKVLFGKYSGHEFKTGDAEFVTVKESEIFGVIEEE